MKKTVLTNCIKNYSEDYLRNIKKEIDVELKRRKEINKIAYRNQFNDFIAYLNERNMEIVTNDKNVIRKDEYIVNLLDQLTANDEETKKELNNFREMFRCINS